MLRFRQIVFIATAVMALAAGPARAAEVLFNPLGTGLAGAVGVSTFDQAPGNALAQNVTITSPVGTTFSLLYQANLFAAADEGGIPINLQNQAFTFAAQFSETIIGNAVLPSGEIALDFAFNPALPNVFNMYAGGPSPGGFGSNLAGTNFVQPPPILSGHAIGAGYESNITLKPGVDAQGNPLPPGACGSSANVKPLDCFNANNYPTIFTLTGGGNTTVSIQVDFVDPNYFPTLIPGDTLLFTTTLQTLPYLNVDPSNCFTPFNAAGVPQAPICNLPTLVGPLNAVTGPHTAFQTDASSSFQVPEPTALMLLGIGLLGSAAGLRRRFARR